MADKAESNHQKPADPAQPAERQQIGLVDTSARKTEDIVARLSKPQQTLREAAIKHFGQNKVKAYIATQTEYVNVAQQIGEAVRFLFDDKGRAPANMPLEEVIAERKRIEKNISWLQALLDELKENLKQIREIEDAALDLLEAQGEE
jgi:hypothetical protein